VQLLAMRLLRSEFEQGDTIVVDVRDGKLDFQRERAAEQAEPVLAGA
jgi:hypothetical protein